MRFDQWLMSTLLQPMGVKSTSTLMVHSAFRGLSKQGVLAGSLCEFLLNYVHQGNVIMPTMTWRTVTKAQNCFDVEATPSHTGILSELFRTQFAAHRSLHPTHSVAIAGPDAEYLTQGHHLNPGPCSDSSPYGLIENSTLKDEAYILLIGVALESCTYIHYFEEHFNFDAFLQSKTEHYRLIQTNDEVVEYNLHRHTRSVRDFHQFGKALHNINALKVALFGDTPITLLKVRALSEVVRAEFERSPLATLPCHSYMQNTL